jgi:hypothetical protein
MEDRERTSQVYCVRACIILLKGDMSFHWVLVAVYMSQFVEHLNIAHYMTFSFLGWKSTSMHSSASQKTVSVIFPVKGMILAFFYGDAM